MGGGWGWRECPLILCDLKHLGGPRRHMEAQPEDPGRSSPELVGADLLQLLPGEVSHQPHGVVATAHQLLVVLRAAVGRTATLAGPPARAAPLAPKPGGLSQRWGCHPRRDVVGQPLRRCSAGRSPRQSSSCAQAWSPRWPSGPATCKSCRQAPSPGPGSCPALPLWHQPRASCG